jgi:hypothetical protein
MIFAHDIITKLLDDVIHNYDILSVDNIKRYLQNTNLNYKESTTLLLIYDDSTHNNNANIIYNLRNCIMDTNTLDIISTQFDNITENQKAVNEIHNTLDWGNIEVYKSYEGTMITVFNHNDKWHISTRTCINADESKWIIGHSHGQLFRDTMQGVFEFNELNKAYVYHFVFVHYMNSGIIYNVHNKTKSKIYHIYTYDMANKKIIDEPINNNIKRPKKVMFNRMCDMLDDLILKSKSDFDNTTITFEGYILRYVINNTFKTYKIQSKIYEHLNEMKPNNNNVYVNYLELYNKNMLKRYIYCFPEHSYNILTLVNKTITELILLLIDIYYLTRAKNDQLYSLIPSSIKTMLYNIHGIYLSNSNKAHITYRDIQQLLKDTSIRTITHVLMDVCKLPNCIAKNKKYVIVYSNLIHK